MIIGLVCAGILLAVTAFARWRWCPQAARRALEARNHNRWEWRLSCLAYRLLGPSLLAVLAVLLVWVAFEGRLGSNEWAIALAIVTGVLGNHVDREIASGWLPYWEAARSSLRAVLPVFPDGHEQHGRNWMDCQALQFNSLQRALLNPPERSEALKRIFEADPHRTEASQQLQPVPPSSGGALPTNRVTHDAEPELRERDKDLREEKPNVPRSRSGPADSSGGQAPTG